MNTKRASLTIVIATIFFIGSAAVHASGPWNGTSLNGTTLNNGGWNGTTLNNAGWNGTTLNNGGWNGTYLNAPGTQGRSFIGETKQIRTDANAKSMKADSTQRQMIKNFRSHGLRLNAIILPEEQCKDIMPDGIAITR